MKDSYSENRTFVSILVFASGPHVVSYVWTPKGQRRRGQARRCLERACADADEDGADLVLSVDPEIDTSMEVLLRFYGSVGFVPWTDADGKWVPKDGAMIRRHRKKEC